MLIRKLNGTVIVIMVMMMNGVMVMHASCSCIAIYCVRARLLRGCSCSVGSGSGRLCDQLKWQLVLLEGAVTCTVTVVSAMRRSAASDSVCVKRCLSIGVGVCISVSNTSVVHCMLLVVAVSMMVMMTAVNSVRVHPAIANFILSFSFSCTVIALIAITITLIAPITLIKVKVGAARGQVVQRSREFTHQRASRSTRLSCSRRRGLHQGHVALPENAASDELLH